MLYVLADDSKDSPHSTHAEACEKCQHTNCFSLHDYATTSCPFQTCNTCLELGKLDTQISNAHDLLIDLSKKRRELKGRINYRHDRFIHHLPIEVISIIFTFYVESSDNHYIKSNRSHVWTPSLILGSVCRRWRNITLGIPHLWTKVIIDPWKHAFSLEVTTDWLSRSRTLPLSLTVKGTEPFNPIHAPPTLPLENLFQLLQSLSGRWETLTLNLPSRFIHRLLHGLKSDFHVDILRIDAADRIGTEMEQIEMKAPLVPKDFFVRNISIARIPMEWSRLTQLDVYLISVDELVHIVTHATKLETCIAHVIKEDEGNYPMPVSPIVNSSLKSLVTSSCSVDANFLLHVTLPALETLKYKFPGDNDENAIDVLADFIERSEPSLQHFSLSYHVESVYENEDWFDSLPSVTHLELIIADPGTFHIQLEDYILALGTQSERLAFPHLQELRIITPSMSPGCWLHLTDAFPDYSDEPPKDGPMVTRPLVSLQVHLETYWTGEEKLMSDDVYDRFREIEASGVRIEVIGGHGVDLLEASAELYGEDFGYGELSPDDGSGDNGSEDDADDAELDEGLEDDSGIEDDLESGDEVDA